MKNLARYIPATFATIFTPQGDGNSNQGGVAAGKKSHLPRYLPRKGTETLLRGLNIGDIDVEFATIFTPQGDGNI